MDYVYTIKVLRGKTKGTLTYESGTTKVETTCWWQLDNAIPAKTYHGCSATKMANKKNSKGEKREGIYIPDTPGHSGIFIHMGTSPSWSDGCIVIVEAELLKIWNSISPKDAANVIVVVDDLPTNLPPPGDRPGTVGP